MEDPGAMSMSELCRPQGVQTLIVPSDPDIKTFIPFGKDGISVIISPAGEILRICQLLAEDEHRIVCLGSPALRGYLRDLVAVDASLHGLAQAREVGFHIHLMPASGARISSMKTSLEWINGRWPCIYYKIDGLDVSVLFTVNQGVVSQQYLITNPSAERKCLRFTLRIGGAQVDTLHVEGAGWVGAGDDEWFDEQQNLPHTAYAFHVAEKQWVTTPEAMQHGGHTAEITTQDGILTPEAFQHGSDNAKITTRGEAVITVFHNDKLLAPETAFQTPVSRDGSDSDDEERDDEQGSENDVSSASSGLLDIASHDVQKLVVQYTLRPYGAHGSGAQDSEIPTPQDIGTSLKREMSENWYFVMNDVFNPILRRHLEHILCLCLVHERPRSEQRRCIAFINDITFESGSTPMNDFHIFRYLLFMYRILDNDDQIRTTATSSTQQNDGPTFERLALQNRIKEACKGHLRWCFEKSLLTSQSWPCSEKSEPSDFTADDKLREKALREKAFIGSLQMLKLYEFAIVIRGEASLVDKCLMGGGELWLSALIAAQDDKSKLWYKDTKREDFEAVHDEGPESFWLPDYRLGDLIYIWKALKSMEDLVRKSDDKTFNSKFREKLTEYKLRPYDVRKNILQCFLYQLPDALQGHVMEENGIKDTLQGLQESTPDASSFSCAVRRSRNRDRLQFTTKDTMLCDGCEWGFFKNDIDVEVLSTNQEILKANIELSWEKTMRAQSDDVDEEFWEKALRCALAITMANLGYLGKSKDSRELQNMSQKRLVDCVTPCGLFAEETDCKTHLPKSLPVTGSQRGCWEIPVLLLRRQFENLKNIWIEDAPSCLVSDDSTPEKQDAAMVTAQQVPQSSDDSSARNAKIDMDKKVRIKNKVASFYGKVDSQMVSDPIERKLKDWLYPLPDFIDKRPPYKPIKDDSMRAENGGLDQRLIMDRIGDRHGRLEEKLKRILNRGLTTWENEKARGWKEAFSRGNTNAYVLDVGRRVAKYSSISATVLDAEDLDKHLRRPRSVEEAKKRFHYIAPLQVEQALILYLATPVLDRRNMAHFYVRHSSFSNYFLEYVHDMADTWTTELHLSFVQLVSIQSKSREEDFEGENVCDGRQRRFLHRYKGSQFDIYKASVSCRFVGDMGDRFWSGYLLTYLPRRPNTFFASTDTTDEDYSDTWNDCAQWIRRDNHNDQRNVLEPYLVERMVAEVYQSTQKILDSIDDWLEPKSDESRYEKESAYSHISKVDDRNSQAQYSRRSNDCPDLEDTLSLIDRLSKSNLEVLEEWRKREKMRFHKPRWSEKDEGKHRKRIESQKKLAEKQVSLLGNQRERIRNSLDRIKSLKQELSDNLSLFEARRAARQSENIRVFTYATVIFYPLSLVASIFSMQGPPKYDTTIPFLQATAIALIITLLIVFNAGILVWPIGRLSQETWSRVNRIARSKAEKTSNLFPVPWKLTLSRIRQSDGEEALNESRYVYLIFLAFYWVVEYPALRIVLAFDFVMKNDITTLNHIGLATVRILVALIFLPLFMAIWVILVTWTILSWAVRSIWMLPFQIRRDAKDQSDKRNFRQEKWESSEGDHGGRTERTKVNEELVEKQIRQARKDRDDRIRKQVSLLLNPPELYQDKLKPYNEKIKALTLRRRKGSRQSSSAPTQPTAHRSMWPFAKRGAEKVADENVEV